MFLFTLVIAVPLLVLWQGLAVSTLWGWFLVPIGAPGLSVVAAAGVCLIASAMRMRHNKSADTSAERYEAIATAVIVPVVALAIGWIIKTFA